MNKKMIALLLAVGGCTSGMHALKPVNGDVSRQDLEAAAAIADVLAEDDSDDSQAMADMQDEGSRWDRAKAGASNLWNRAANSRFGQAVGDAKRTIANNKKKAALVAAVLAMIASRGLYNKGYGQSRSRLNPLGMNYGFNTRLNAAGNTLAAGMAPYKEAAIARAQSTYGRLPSFRRTVAAPAGGAEGDEAA